MPGQGPAWTEFLSCHVCCSMFDEELHRPISLGCGHTVCRTCLNKLPKSKCPFDQSAITSNVNDLPVNYALLQLVGATVPDKTEESLIDMEKREYYDSAKKCIEDLAVHLKTDSSEKTTTESEDVKVAAEGSLQVSSILSRPMQRKLVSLVNCQLLEEEGRSRAMRTARSLGERTVTELILQHQNPHQLSANLWAAVRARGCQFLGPAMQEEVLKLILLVLEDASALSRKVLVLFVVQHLEESYPQASKTAIGHVVQLLYRASCFKVTKREEASSVMQLKEEFRTYDALRREHDSQVVQIAMEAGLRISPEQWSSLLYGDASHKSHMQSIIDKLQTPLSFSQSISELTIALQRTGDPCNLQRLRPHLEFLANIDPSPDAPSPSWENLEAALKALRTVVQGFMDFFNNYSQKKELLPLQNARYKTSMCRDQMNQGICPRGTSCTFAHSQEELEKYRARSKKLGLKETSSASATSALSLKEKAELDRINIANSEKLAVYSKTGAISTSADRSRSSDQPLTVDTPVVQSLNTLTLSPRNLSPSSPHLPKLNSGIPDGNTTPSVVTPAHYRKPGLGMGTSVKETHYQGMTKMSPCEMSAIEASPFMCHPYMDPRGHPRGLGSHPSLHCPQDPGFYHPPCPSYQPPQQSAVVPPDDLGIPHQHYCQAQQDMMHPYAPPQHYCTSHEMSCQPLQPSNYPAAHNYHRYYSRPAPPHPPLYTPLAPQAPAGLDYSHQDAQSLNDLHVRRNNIIAQLNQNPPCSTYGNLIINRPQYSMSTSSSDNSSNNSNNNIHMQTSKSGIQSSPRFSQPFTPAINKSVADTYVAARTMFSLANSGVLNELQTSSSRYVPWSSDDSDLVDKNDDTKWNVSWSTHGNDKNTESKKEVESEEDEAKQILSWLDEEKANLENDVYKSKLSLKSLQATQSCDDQTFIPFDPPLVSRFGPISRMARAKANNTDPVQVTADEVVRKVMPVTAVTQMDCPVPVAAPVPSRFCVKEMPTRIGHPMFSLEVPRRDHFLMQNDPTRLSRQQMMREVVRLESKAQDARTEDESLALELQAIELKISLQTPDNLEQAHGKQRCGSVNTFGHQKYKCTVPSVRPSDPALTAQEQKKLHQLTAGFSGGDHRSEHQEHILSQLLKIKELGSQTKKYQFDH